MRRGLLVALLCMLTGCGAPQPTATPYTPTTTNYRQALVQQAGLASTAVDAAQAACEKGDSALCEPVLSEQARRFHNAAVWIRDTPAPQACLRVLGGYIGLMENGEAFFDSTQVTLGQHDPARFTQVLHERYTAYTTAKVAATSPVPNDACQ